jgi:hypothetical protein
MISSSAPPSTMRSDGARCPSESSPPSIWRRRSARTAPDWLDHQILGRDKSDPVESGFGREVIHAKRQREQVLIAQSLAKRDGENRLRVRRDLLATLERRGAPRR